MKILTYIGNRESHERLEAALGKGYEVITAMDTEMAKRIVKENISRRNDRTAIDLILAKENAASDKNFELIRQQNPNIRFIFTSNEITGPASLEDTDLILAAIATKERHVYLTKFNAPALADKVS